jgi:polyisoprenoid-binding protein YceI
MKTITPEALQAALASPSPPILLHVLPEESWTQQRLPGSQCACVYEVGFLENVSQLAPDLATPLVVYGAGLPTLESAAAAEKLTAAGYLNVTDFTGGLTAWVAAGLGTEGTGEILATPNQNGTWHIDPTASIIRWTGRNLFNHHEGHLRLSGGSFHIENDTLQQSNFVIDMTSIACTDIPDQAANQMLLHHLANSDFFLTSEYPEAHFNATSATPILASTPGTPNYEIEGTLTVRGVTQSLRFPALLAINDEGILIAQAQLEIDRTRWGINYGSGRLFAWLGKHVVNDLVALHLKIKAQRR